MTASDIIVVGAGISGLRTADRLCALGLAVTVLEARDRVGGRLLSTPVPGGRIDLGATWFWPNEPLVTQLVADLGLETFAQHMAGDMVVQAESIQRGPNQLDVPSSRLADGFGSLTAALADRLPPGTIRLGTAATSVEQVGHRLVVATPTDSFAADHLVLAVPPALAIASIEFDPVLDPDLAIIAGNTPVWMGATTKIVAVFDHTFWRNQGLAGSAFSFRGPMREVHDMSGPNGKPAALFGFATISPGDPAPTTEDIVTQLTELFGAEAATPASVHVMDWRREHFTTPPAALGLTDHRSYGHPVFQQPALGGRLHWAATETSPSMPGHVEGALVAAERTVSTIEKTINRSTP